MSESTDAAVTQRRNSRPMKPVFQAILLASMIASTNRLYWAFRQTLIFDIRLKNYYDDDYRPDYVQVAAGAHALGGLAQMAALRYKKPHRNLSSKDLKYLMTKEVLSLGLILMASFHDSEAAIALVLMILAELFVYAFKY